MDQAQQVNSARVLDEDVYCLGFVIMYLMTGLYPQFNITKYEIKSLIIDCFSSYSKKLVRLVQAMTEELPTHRIQLKILREKLKEDERKIIIEESLDFMKEKCDKRERMMTNHQAIRIENSFSPQMEGKIHTRKRSLFLSPIVTRSR